jgi:hypothetical protein
MFFEIGPKIFSHRDKRYAQILMRQDGMIEGRIYKEEEEPSVAGAERQRDDYEVVYEGETLNSVRTIILEELGY